MSKSLYNNKTPFGRVYLFFSSILEKVASRPTRHILTLFIISIICMEGVDSVRHVFRGFFTRLVKKSINAIYYACSYAKALVTMALSIIPKDLGSLPVFLCVDDTLIEKTGEKFEDVSILFDHAAHKGQNYVNGHCFVSLSLCIPIWNSNSKVAFLPVPLGCRMWAGGKKKDAPTKLGIAAGMIRDVMPSLSNQRNVIILCDSWYTKTELLSLTKEYGNLGLIGNVRIDTALYGPPPAPTGKRGRPRTRGEKLCLDDFELTDKRVGDYFVGHRKVVTNLLKGIVVEAFVTSTQKEGGAMRLFISTVSATDLSMFCAWYEKPPIKQAGSNWFQYLPLMLYRVRWDGTEVGYYEQKTFWGLRKYMLRSRTGIERLINLIIVSYSGMKLLPYYDCAFSTHRGSSPQEFRSFIAQKIREQVFLTSYAETVQVDIKSKVLDGWLKLNNLGDKVAA